MKADGLIQLQVLLFVQNNQVKQTKRAKQYSKMTNKLEVSDQWLSSG